MMSRLVVRKAKRDVYEEISAYLAMIQRLHSNPDARVVELLTGQNPALHLLDWYQDKDPHLISRVDPDRGLRNLAAGIRAIRINQQ